MAEKLEILLSCMHQDNISIIERTKISSNALVINQANFDDSLYVDKGEYGVTFITTQERGLSKSRNMAIKKAKGDICLICDDDEIMNDDYETKILDAFIEYPTADIIAFQIENAGKQYSSKGKRVNYITALKIASWQIAFRRKSIIDKDIWFDEMLGSGVSKAGGEENMFLYDCLKKGLKIYYVPVVIGTMVKGESQWFHGFTKEYFYDRGVFTKKLMGSFFASLYAVYFLVFKYPLYNDDISFRQSLFNLFKGIYKS